MRRAIVVALLVLALGALLLVRRGGSPSGLASMPSASDSTGASPGASSVTSSVVQPATGIAPSASEAGAEANSSLRAGVGAALEAELLVRVRCEVDGVPVPDARVYPDTGSVPKDVFWRYFSKGPALTDTRGEARILVPADQALSIQVRPTYGWKTKLIRSEPIAPGTLGELTVELESDSFAVFCGRVFDAATNAPIAGASVTLPEASGAEVLTTDGDGRFQVRVDLRKRDGGWIQSPGYALAELTLTSDNPTPASAYSFALSRMASVRVTVVRRGAPSAGERVRLQSECNRPFVDVEDVELAGTTDEAGTVLFEAVPVVSDVTIHAYTAGTRVRTIRIQPPLVPDETRQVRLTVGDGVGVNGCVVGENGERVARCQVMLEFDADRARAAPPDALELQNATTGSREARTDADGRFAFADVPSGPWWITTGDVEVPASELGIQLKPSLFDWSAPPADPDDPFLPRSDVWSTAVESLDLAPGEDTRTVELRIYRGLSIKGHVLDAHGRPAAAEVSAYFLDGPPQSAWREPVSADADVAGAFVLAPLRPGRYAVRASSDAGRSEGELAEAGTDGLELRLEPAGSIEGVVHCGDGVSGYGRVWVMATDDGGVAAMDVFECSGVGTDATPANDVTSSFTWNGVKRAMVQREGAFKLRPLAPGRYTVFADTDEGAFARRDGVDVVADRATREVELRLERGGRLRIRYDGTAPFAACEIRVGGALVHGNGIASGSSIEVSLPLGSVLVQLTDPATGRSDSRTVSIDPGAPSDVAFDWRGP